MFYDGSPGDLEESLTAQNVNIMGKAALSIRNKLHQEPDLRAFLCRSNLRLLHLAL